MSDKNRVEPLEGENVKELSRKLRQARVTEKGGVEKKVSKVKKLKK